METTINNKQIILKQDRDCTGCAACIAVCPKNAIIQKKIAFKSWIPEINTGLCVKCGLCVSVCSFEATECTYEKKAFIAYNKDREMRVKSSSGGVFSALAVHVLKQGGIVYGSELSFKDKKVSVRHVGIESIEDLPRVMGSKYVQSDCEQVYGQVKKQLDFGRIVLFSGCSCQIAGLLGYLKNTDRSNLYTLDLICHGTPSVALFQEYITFLERKYKGTINSLTFRDKDRTILYRIKISLICENGKKRNITIPMEKSGYFMMFMGEQSYRPACYRCQYASLNKPADITMGDYFEVKADYPELFEGEAPIDDSCGLSSVIVHTTKGERLILKSSAELFSQEVSVFKVKKSHANLNRPSKFSMERNILLKGYNKFGFCFIENYYNVRRAIVFLPKKIKVFLCSVKNLL